MTIVADKELKITGRLVKIAELKKDWDEDIDAPEDFVNHIRCCGVKSDIFTFMQRLPESRPKFKYYMEWDSIAAIPIISYEHWLKKQIVQNSRKKIGLAQRKGVNIKRIPFDDDLVRGILDIYHETPILQGKPNRQYKTDFETAKKLNSTFLDRAQFIGAFYKDELIAYIKLVSAGRYMRTMGILAKIAHREKGAMNLLIAKAVETCAETGMQYLMYAKFDYGKRGSETLKEFKRNLGFESIILPRYYIPLNAWGEIILKLKLHRDLAEYLPQRIIRMLIDIRSSRYEKKYAEELRKLNYSTDS
jgi:hypothetical protein